MAISFATGGGVKEMVQWYDADTTGGWGGANDGLETFGANIEGTDCIYAALRKNENVSITYTSTLTGIPANSQYIANFYTTIGQILTSMDVDVNDGGAGTANFNILTEFTADAKLTLKSFNPIAFDLTAGTLNVVTNNLSDMSFNIVVGNFNLSASNNFFWDAAYVGNGITLTGTTVGDELFREAQAYDVSADIHNGVLAGFEEVVFSQSNIDINTTTGNSTNESLTFYETLNGNNTYTLGGTGTAVFNGTNIQTTGTVTSTIDLSSMTSFTMTSGSFKKIGTVTFGSGQTISRASFIQITTFNSGATTFTDNTLDTITTANIQTSASGLRIQSVTTPTLSSGFTLTNCSFTGSGQLDISGGSRTLTSCSFTDATGASAVLASAATIGNITGTTFTRTAGTSNAVDIGNVGTNTTIDWDANILSGYGTQLAGNNITSTTNGAIAVNFTSNVTLTIQVVNGATIPTVEISGTGTVNIVAAVTATISGVLGNSEISVMQNPSPYSQNGASRNSLYNEDTVAAVTGTDIELDTGGGANVTQILSTTTDFTTIGLVAGDFIRVTQRNNLGIFDTFEVVSVSTNAIDVVDVASSTIRQADLIDSPGETVTVEKINASYSFSTSSGTTVDILVYRVGSLPIYLLNQTVTGTNNSFPIQQTLDRNYDSFEV